ncbi:MAG: MerR family transcriptional regulator [Actinomycetota bacterium]|nr:MerR family transcriptional regulator [Actinomycetota bacterium]
MSDSELTIEQLAMRSGLPTSTIRMYQTKGLLHAPRRVGRTARYDQSHLQRLVLVQRLQDRGFSLPAIAELIDARAQGATVADVLGLTGGPDDWVPVSVRQMRTMVSVRDLRPRLLRRVTRLGLLTWRKGRPYARRWALESGLRLCTLAVPPTEVVDEYERLRTATDQIAAGFVAIFERRLWPRIGADVAASDQLGVVRAMLEELVGVAEGVVVAALRESIRDAAEEFARRHELLPADGEEPEWLDDPVPALFERAPESETPDIQGFLAELNADDGDPVEPGRP